MIPSNPRREQQQMSRTTAPGGVFVDAITARHVSSDPTNLLQRRCLTHSKQYGWTYDVWVDNPGRYALTGANSRFSLPAIAQRVAGLVADSAAAAQQLLGALQQSNKR